MTVPVISQLFTMVLLMVAGVVLNKKKYLTVDNAKELSVILTRVAVPANMIILMQRPYSHDIFMRFLKVCGGAFLLCSVGAILFFVVGKVMKLSQREAGLFSTCGAYSNIIFMGQPLIMAMYGEKGLIFCVAVTFVSTMFLFTVCSAIICFGIEQKRSTGKMLKEALLNLVAISGTIGFICFAKSIHLPAPIADALQFAANTTVCISMVYIGFLMADANLKEVIRDKQVYIFCFLTLVVMPILTKWIASSFLDGIALSVLVVLMGTPAGAVLPSFAELYGNDEKKASQYVFVSTILSIITLPLVVEFLC